RMIRPVLVLYVQLREFRLDKQRISSATIHRQRGQRFADKRFGIMLRLIRRIDGVKTGCYSRSNKRRSRIFLPGGAVDKRWFWHLRVFLLGDTTHVTAGTRAHRFPAVPHFPARP